MKKTAALVAAITLGLFAEASPLAIPLKKVAGECAERVSAKLGGRAAGELAARGGSALARVTAERAAARAGAGVAGNAAKHITSGKILATGGATALVVGAHEMADGVQAMGEGVKETLKENPDAIGKVTDAILSPIRLVVMAVCAFVGLILFWVFWPWIGVFRNWSRLRALKVAARVRSDVSAGTPGNGNARGVPSPGDVIDITPGGRTGFRSGRITAGLLFTIVGVTALAGTGIAVGVFSCDGGKSGWTSWLSGKSAEVLRRERMMRELDATYREAIDFSYKRFRDDVSRLAESEFAAVRSMVPAVADRFGAFSRMKDYCLLMVKDKITEGNSMQKRIEADLEADYYRGLYAARDNVIRCLERFIYDVDLARKAYSVKVESELAARSLPGDGAYLEVLEKCETSIEKAKKNLAKAQLGAGIAVACEALLIRQTGAILGKALSRAVARQVVVMGASTALVAVDGPLPIGDIIALIATVGCTAWTAYDVYKATRILPDKLRGSLLEATDTCKKECLKEVLALGEKIREESLRR